MGNLVTVPKRFSRLIYKRESARRKKDQKDLFSRTESDSFNSGQLPTNP